MDQKVDSTNGALLKKVRIEYNEAVFDTDRDRALLAVHNAVNKGISPEDIVFQVVIPGIELMIKAISENFDASLAQHFMTSQIAAEVTDEMILRFKEAKNVIGRVVMGTSQGDFHGLGKRIVIGCLRALTIDVVDLGLNVPPHRFVEEALAFDAQVIGISSMMVHTARGENGCLKVRSLLKEQGLEDKIKIIVGGAPYRYDSGLYRIVGADTWSENGITAAKVITELIREVKK